MKPPQRYSVPGLWVETAGEGFYALRAGGSRWCPDRAALLRWLRWPKGPSRDGLVAWLDTITASPEATTPTPASDEADTTTCMII
jgi:hypothetical protein